MGYLTSKKDHLAYLRAAGSAVLFDSPWLQFAIW